MKLRYNERIYPTARQRQDLARFFGCARVVYNDGLRERRTAWRNGEPYVSDTALQKKVITAAKRTEEREWLRDAPSVVLVQSLQDLHVAYRNFFASRNGVRKGPKIAPPRRKRKSGRQSIRFTRNGFSLRDDGPLFLAKLGDVRVRWSRPLPSEPSSVTVVKDPAGRYFASFVVETEEEALPELDLDETGTGIDLGLSSYAVLRGRKIGSPRFFRRQEKKLRRAQRRLSRSEKGSVNRRKAGLAVAKIHARIADRRRDFIEQETTRVVRENQAVYVEDLNVKGMARGRWGKSVHDQGLGRFVRVLESKCLRYGRRFVRVGRFFPSTQRCSVCGSVEGPKGPEGLAVRRWTCSCGAVHDRDENAEANLRAEGRRIFAAGLAEK
ncbi:RNA-guided endonuclease InsQ/TnpB family protein [Streptomyces filamentosus]|uniref:RNA-guided endonuclease InsQ/TnpB family protein n=1 Tax=Streptomyces filamentosus TaxID=67294 RepID=UPI00123B1A54|nr:RNA-guided endonuclease TnpB family protein [Streptomyces filamentosus]KAA6219422.1 transposase [Streptomyces filamentosus]